MNQVSSPATVFVLAQLGMLVGLGLGAELPDGFIDNWSPALFFWWVCLTIALVVLVRLWSDQVIRHLAIFLVGAIVALTYAAAYRIEVDPGDLPYNQSSNFTAIVDSYPIVQDRTQRFYVRTNAFTKPIRLHITVGREPLYHRGEVVEIDGVFEEPFVTPEFDYARYLETKETFGVIRNPDRIVVLQSAQGWLAYRNSLREQILAVFRRTLPEPAASLAAGLTLGIQPTIDTEFAAALKTTNLTHLAAVSGQNLTLVVLVFFFVLRRWWLRFALLITCVLLVSYVALVGTEASIIRASIMASVFLIGPLIGRPMHAFRSLVLAALAIAIASPLAVTRDVGFQLSFVTFGGIVLFGPIVEQRLVWLPAWLRSMLAVTLTASLAAFPLQLAIFHTISWYGVVTNLLVSLLVSLAMVGSLCLAIFGLLWLPFAQIIAWILYLPLEYVHLIAVRFADLPGSLTKLTVVSWVGWSLVLLEVSYFVWLGWRELRIGPVPLREEKHP